jgi:hypothetical protein
MQRIPGLKGGTWATRRHEFPLSVVYLCDYSSHSKVIWISRRSAYGETKGVC